MPQMLTYPLDVLFIETLIKKNVVLNHLCSHLTVSTYLTNETDLHGS
jgi:hypothetical protein